MYVGGEWIEGAPTHYTFAILQRNDHQRDIEAQAKVKRQGKYIVPGVHSHQGQSVSQSHDRVRWPRAALVLITRRVGTAKFAAGPPK